MIQRDASGFGFVLRGSKGRQFIRILSLMPLSCTVVQIAKSLLFMVWSQGPCKLAICFQIESQITLGTEIQMKLNLESNWQYHFSCSLTVGLPHVVRLELCVAFVDL